MTRGSRHVRRHARATAARGRGDTAAAARAPFELGINCAHRADQWCVSRWQRGAWGAWSHLDMRRASGGDGAAAAAAMAAAAMAAVVAAVVAAAREAATAMTAAAMASTAAAAR